MVLVHHHWHTVVSPPVCPAVFTAEYAEELVRDAKNGGEKALQRAVEYRLSKLRSRDKHGLFQWVDGTSSHGHFIVIMRGAAVDLVKRFGTEIFIDRSVTVHLGQSRVLVHTR